jgi:hypothetical protein
VTAVFYPVTPGGTACTWLKSATRDEAIAKLLVDAKHMPYRNWEAFVERGYIIAEQEVEPVGGLEWMTPG